MRWHPVEIGAGAEALARAAQQHRARILQSRERLRQCRDQVLIECIVVRGAVKGDLRDPVRTVFDNQAIGGHGHILNTPKRVGGDDRRLASARARPRVSRVRAGSRMPSSHSRAVA